MKEIKLLCTYALPEECNDVKITTDRIEYWQIYIDSEGKRFILPLDCGAGTPFIEITIKQIEK